MRSDRSIAALIAVAMIALAGCSATIEGNNKTLENISLSPNTQMQIETPENYQWIQYFSDGKTLCFRIKTLPRMSTRQMWVSEPVCKVRDYIPLSGQVGEFTYKTDNAKEIFQIGVRIPKEAAKTYQVVSETERFEIMSTRKEAK